MDTNIGRDTILKAMDELAYRNKKAPKYLLLEAIVRRYPEDPSQPLEEEISSDDLIMELWDTGGDPLTIANRRKNFNSIKSAINTELKQLYKDGKNSSGIVIGPDNTFIMSDEAREDLLTSLARTAGDGSISALDQLAQMMGLLKQILLDSDIVDQSNSDDALGQIHQLLKKITEKLGMDEEEKDQEEDSGDDGKGENGEDRAQAEDEKDSGEAEEESTSDSEADLLENEEEVLVAEDVIDDEDLEEDDSEELENTDDFEILEEEEVFEEELEVDGEEAGESEGDDDPEDDEDMEIVELDSDEEPEDIDSIDDGGIGEDAEGEGTDDDGEGFGDEDGNIGGDDGAGDETLDDDEDVEIVELDSDEEPEDIDSIDDGGIGEDAEGEGTDDDGEGFGDEDGKIGEDDGAGDETIDDDEDVEIVELGSDEELEYVEDLEGEGGLDQEEDGGGPGLPDDDEDVEIVELGPDEELEYVDDIEGEDTDGDGLGEEDQDGLGEGEGGLDQEEDGGGAGLPDDDEDVEVVELGPDDEFEDVDVLEEDEDLEIVELQEGEELVDIEETEEDEDLDYLEEDFEIAEDAPGDVPEDLEGDYEDADVLEDDEEIEEIDEDLIGEEDDLEALDEILDEDEDFIPEDQEDFEEVGFLDDDEELEILDDDQELEEVEEQPEQAALEASMGPLGADASLEQEPDKARVLAEQFDGFLGSMEKHYNQYLLIPEGRYIVGAQSPGKGDRPLQKIDMPPFYIGKYSVTNALFEIFVEKTGYVTTAEERGYGMVYKGRYEKVKDARTGKVIVRFSQSRGCEKVEGANWYQPMGPGSTLYRKRNHPVVQVSRRDAIAFAAWTGKKLPSEDEWETAARTQEGLIYPWGDEWEDGKTNTEESKLGDTCPVEFFNNTNTLNISDTVGNVLEWTTDLGDPSKPDLFIVKGASWVSSPPAPLFSRILCKGSETSNILGFRCVAI